MHARGRIAARVRTARPHAVVEAKGLERRRGLLSFLTWAFVLTELFGRDSLGPSSARASDADETTRADDRAEVAGQPTDIADRPSASSAPGDSSEHAPTLVSPGATLVLPASASGDASRDLSSDGPERIDNGPIDAVHATASGGGSVAVPGSSDADGATAGSDPSAAPELVAAGAPSLDAAPFLQLSVSPNGLVHGVSEIVEAVPLVGDVLSAAADTVVSAVGTILDGVGGLLGRSDPDGPLASGGSIEIQGDTASLPFAPLHTADGFTDYGIALELDLSGGLASPLPSVEGASLADVIKQSSDLFPTPASIAGEPGLSDDAGHRSASDVLA